MASIIYHALSRKYSGSGNIDGSDERVEEYEILFDSPPFSELQCYTDVRSPRYGSRHNDPGLSNFLFVTNLSASSDDGVKFVLEVTYSNIEVGESLEDPRNERPRVTARSQQRSIFTVFDAEGNVVTNYAGDIIGPREVTRSFWIYTITFNHHPYIWPNWLSLYADAVNQSSVMIRGRRFRRRTLKLDNIAIGDVQEKNDVQYVEVSFDVTYHQEGWRVQILNEGLSELDPVNTRVPILEGKSAKKPITKPVFLDFDGKAFRNNDVDRTLKAVLDPSEIVTIEVQDFVELPYTALPRL